MKRLTLVLIAVFYVVQWETPSKPDERAYTGAWPVHISWEKHQSGRFLRVDSAEAWMKLRFWTNDRKRLNVQILRLEETEIRRPEAMGVPK